MTAMRRSREQRMKELMCVRMRRGNLKRCASDQQRVSEYETQTCDMGQNIIYIIYCLYRVETQLLPLSAAVTYISVRLSSSCSYKRVIITGMITTKN